jgi:hypothetical protein
VLYNLAMILPTEGPYIGEEVQPASEDEAIALFLLEVELAMTAIKHKEWAKKLMEDEMFYALPKEEKVKIHRIANGDPEGDFQGVMKSIKPLLGLNGVKKILETINPDNEFLPLIKQAWD